MERLIGMHGHRADLKVFARPNNVKGDFTAVRDEGLVQKGHREVVVTKIFGFSLHDQFADTDTKKTTVMTEDIFPFSETESLESDYDDYFDDNYFCDDDEVGSVRPKFFRVDENER